jgi:hypothetical protein
LKKHTLFKNKNIIILKDVAILILETRKGSLKIHSSTIGNIIVTFKMLIEVNLISLREGNKLKYLKGITIRTPATMSITKRARNVFQTRFRKIVMELIS